MIVGRGEVKAFLFDNEAYTIETAKNLLKGSHYLYSPSIKQSILEEKKKYKERLKTVRRFLKCPDEVDDLKISFDEKYIIFEFDPTVGDDDLVIYNNYNLHTQTENDILVNIIPLLN